MLFKTIKNTIKLCSAKREAYNDTQLLIKSKSKAITQQFTKYMFCQDI